MIIISFLKKDLSNLYFVNAVILFKNFKSFNGNKLDTDVLFIEILFNPLKFLHTSIFSIKVSDKFK